MILQAGDDIPGIVIEKNQFHSLETTNEMGVVLSVKSGNYTPLKEDEQIIF